METRLQCWEVAIGLDILIETILRRNQTGYRDLADLIQSNFIETVML